MTVWTVPGVCNRVIDADTLVATCDLGWQIRWVGKVRLLGVDAPELFTPEGLAAKAFVEGLLPPGAGFVLASQKLDSFGRSLGLVWLPDGSELGARLIEAGHAVPYDR